MEEIINSVMQSPENTNPNVLRSQLKAIQGEGSGGPGYSVEKQRTILFDGSVVTKGDFDSGMFYGTISEYITAPTIIVTFNGDEYTLEQTIDKIVEYGEFGDDGPSFANIPFAINSYNGETCLYTESSGRYLIKIESDETVVTPTDEFKEAVAKSGVSSNTGAIYAEFYSLPHNVDETEQWACDKTYDELVAAYNSGSVILGEITGHVFVMLYEPRRGVFSGDTTKFNINSSELFYCGVNMHPDDPLGIEVYKGSVSLGR